MAPPMGGKTTLLQSLARMHKQSDFAVHVEETKRVVQLDVVLSQLSIRFITVQGSFLTEEFFPELLIGARCLVFVVSASAGKQEQQRIFEQYVSYAVRVGAHWDNIPWIFVLNKVDLGNQNPLLQHIPTQFHDDIIHCSATLGIGIEQLWQKIITVIPQTPQ
ncbi:GTPase domain-containing protein [bacterium]|nr:GTPase domain-containing protein [bacterium]